MTVYNNFYHIHCIIKPYFNLSECVIYMSYCLFVQGGKAGWSGGPTSDGPGDSYMLQVRGTSILNTKAIQVPMVAGSLNSNDVFVVFLKTAVYIWCGKVSELTTQRQV